MAYQKQTIDVEARFIDNLSAGASAAKRAIDEMGKTATDAGKKVIDLGDDANDAQKDLNNLGKTKPTLDADDSGLKKKLDENIDKVNRLGTSKAKAVLDAVDNASTKIQKIEDTARSFTRKTWEAVIKVRDIATAPLRKLYNTIFNIKTLIAGVMTGFAVQKLIASPIALADTMKNSLTGFQTMLGEAAGTAKYNELMDLAKATPFDANGVISQAQKLIGYGFDAETITDTLTTLGDVAAGTGRGESGLEGLSLVLGQIKARPTLSGQDVNQLSGWGVNANQYLADYFGVSKSEVVAMREAGKITGDDAVTAILAGMKENYGGMMEKMATSTFSGIMETIADTVRIDVWSKWGKGLQSGGIKALTKIVDLFDKSEEKLEAIGDLMYDIGEEISNWAADKVEKTINNIMNLVDTDAFKNASLGGKVKILWDGVIADPIKEWWEGGGKEKAAKTAGNIGSTMGKMLSNIILGVLGATDYLEDGQIDKEGAGIAESFVRGFLDNFDGAAITDAFVDAIENVWDALPMWAKGLLIGKVALTGISAAGSAARGIQAIGGVLGSASTATGTLVGTGLIGGSAKIGYALGSGAYTGGGLALAGAGSVAGGVTGAVALGKGVYDLIGAHKAGQEGDVVEENAKALSGTLAIGGVATGAATGAAIGAMFGGIGAVPGALIGAGIGGVAGMLSGNKLADDLREECDATRELTYDSEELKSTIEDTESSAAELEAAFIKACSENIANHFGDIALSIDEIQAAASSIVQGDNVTKLENLSTAITSAKESLTAFESSAQDLNKLNWKAGLNVYFTDEEQTEFTEAVSSFVSNAEAVLEAEHYKLQTSVDLLLEPDSDANDSILSTSDAFFTDLQSELDTKSNTLEAKVKLALEDGVIDDSEEEVIEKLQSKIAEITNKVAQAQSEAELEAIKIKFSSGDIDADTFANLQEELTSQIESTTDQYDTALTTSITSLKLQLDEGAISQSEYDEQIAQLTEGYQANIDTIHASASNVQLEILGDAYSDILGKDGADKLSTALSESLSQGIDPAEWDSAQAAKFLGVSSLSEETASNLGTMLSTIAEQITTGGDATAVGNAIADGIVPNEEAMSKFGLTAKALVQQSLDENLSSFNVDTVLNVNVTKTNTSDFKTSNAAKKARGGIVGGATIPGYAEGGIVGGGSKLIRVAEEGSPEMIIPLSSQRRDRGLKLWAKAGEMLGADKFARGGLTSGQTDLGIRNRDESTRVESSGTGNTEIDVGGVTVEIHVDGNDGQNIAEAIKGQSNEIVETVTGILARAFEEQFANTPTRGGATA